LSRRLLVVAASFVAASIIFSIHPFHFRSGNKLDEIELQAFLDGMSSRFPNGTPRYVDSAGIAFQMDEDGALHQVDAEPIRILLLERVVLPLEDIRGLMERGGPIFRVYRSAKEGMHTSLQGFLSMGNRTFVLGSVSLTEGQVVEADLLWAGRDQPGQPSALTKVGRVLMQLENPASAGHVAEGRISLSQNSATQVHGFFLLPFQPDRASIEALGSAPASYAELRARILEYIRSKS
jgi:hypothetical protein